MQVSQVIGYDRVRLNTTSRVNRTISRQIEDNIRYYSNADVVTLKKRIDELNKEWDIERTLELNAAAASFAGVLLAAAVNKKWLILPLFVSAFLAQHAIQGWCPPLQLFRNRGVRTLKEIEAEKQALLQVLDNKMGVCLLK